MREIDILLFDQVNLLDVAGPAQAFTTAQSQDAPLYQTRFVSVDGNSVQSCCGLRLCADAALLVESTAKDLIIPGGRGVDDIMQCGAIHGAVKAWNNSKDRRLISVCSGALVLASAGVLNGLKATTHWSRTQQAQRQFPQVDWLIDKLFVRDQNVFTSAGVTTGIDLSLAVIQMDHGGQCALDVARELVVYMQRHGKQSQFAGLVDLQLQASDSLSTLVDAIVEYPERVWTVGQMAAFCNLTERTLIRRCHKNLNTSPKRFVEKIRVSKACEWMSTGIPLGLVISRSGLSDQQQMNRAFKRQLGTSVNEYLARFAVKTS
jgi:transcriptional regulator GlxA family with amidase domain